MSRLKIFLAWTLVALWPLLSAHCKLEAFTDLIACSDTAESHSPCADDSCADLESGKYRSQDHQVLPAVPHLACDWLTPSPFEFSRPDSGAEFSPAPTPTKLSIPWQFVQRTASPPRAPSLAS